MSKAVHTRVLLNTAPPHLAHVQARAGEHGLVGGGAERQEAGGVAQRLNGVQQPQVCKVVDQHLCAKREGWVVCAWEKGGCGWGWEGGRGAAADRKVVHQQLWTKMGGVVFFVRVWCVLEMGLGWNGSRYPWAINDGARVPRTRAAGATALWQGSSGAETRIYQHTARLDSLPASSRLHNQMQPPTWSTRQTTHATTHLSTTHPPGPAQLTLCSSATAMRSRRSRTARTCARSKQANHRLTGVARAPAGSHQRRRRGCTTYSACRTKEEAHSAAQRSRLAAQRRQPLQGPAVGAVDGGHALAPQAQRPHGQARSATYQCTNAY